jgi:hypothetical protein
MVILYIELAVVIYTPTSVSLQIGIYYLEDPPCWRQHLRPTTRNYLLNCEYYGYWGYRYLTPCNQP